MTTQINFNETIKTSSNYPSTWIDCCCRFQFSSCIAVNWRINFITLATMISGPYSARNVPTGRNKIISTKCEWQNRSMDHSEQGIRHIVHFLTPDDLIEAWEQLERRWLVTVKDCLTNKCYSSYQLVQKVENFVFEISYIFKSLILKQCHLISGISIF
jgi:hypothetical protein